MRITDARVWVAALAFLAAACGPHLCRRPPHGPAMMMGCGPDACGYQSTCFSDGAVRSNDGVCQACSGGKWVAATGCHECGCGKMDKSAPCEHEHHEHRSKPK